MKWALKSWTIIVNLLAAVPIILEEVGHLPQFAPYKDEAAILLVVANLVLRFKTTEPVYIRRPSSPE